MSALFLFEHELNELNEFMKIKINNEYKCFMAIPNVNYWYDDEGRKIFIGWLFWGIDIIFKGYGL